MAARTKMPGPPLPPIVPPVEIVAAEPPDPFRIRLVKSLTMWWAYLLIAAGFGLDALDLLSAFAATTEVQEIIKYYGGPYASHILKGIGAVTALVRIRSLRKGK